MKQIMKYTASSSVRLTKVSRQLQRDMKLYRKITVYSLDEKFAPFCYGIFHPRIILPAEYSTEESELILRHELQHIKSFDFLFRLIALLIVAMHFFNPFAYLLSYEVGKMCELACDEKVLKRCTKQQQSKYGTLLLNTAAPSILQTYTNSFSGNNEKTMKERLAMIKHPKKTKLVVFLSCAALTVCLSTLPAAAYELPEVEEIEHYSSNDLEGSYMISTSDTAPYEADPNETYFANTDCFFIDKSGNLFVDLESTSASTRSLCSHNYVSGYVYTHTPNTSGGCTYTTYSAKYCTKCGSIKDKTFVSSNTYAKCPHK